MPTDGSCPVCKGIDGEPANVRDLFDRDAYQVTCPACGYFKISRTAIEDNRLDEDQRRALSHKLRWRTELSEPSTEMITSYFLEDFRKNYLLPNVSEQIDNLVLYLSKRLKHMGREYGHCDPALISAIGAIDRSGAIEIISALIDRGLIAGHVLGLDPPDAIGLKPTLSGWLRAGDIERGSISEKFAFMAMQYGDSTLESYVAEVFRPATLEAGFDLEVLRDRPQAGVIDNYLRSRLNLCRFVIADLSHANNGAYWEAGYAEGIGKPVIYTCHKEQFDQRKTHFDTNHSTTIVWLPDQPDEAKKQLLACIRNSIPEAK